MMVNKIDMFSDFTEFRNVGEPGLMQKKKKYIIIISDKYYEEEQGNLI